jgi:hypothetical protein
MGKKGTGHDGCGLVGKRGQVMKVAGWGKMGTGHEGRGLGGKRGQVMKVAGWWEKGDSS